jgi:hypothetical protein
MSNWVELVPMAEFTYNYRRTTTTGHLPVNANYRFHPNSGISQLTTDTLPVSSKAYRYWIIAILDDCRNTLKKTGKTRKKYMDRDRAKPLKY